MGADEGGGRLLEGGFLAGGYGINLAMSNISVVQTSVWPLNLQAFN